MEKTEILSYCIGVFSSLSDAVERYPEVKEDLLRRMDAQHDDSDGECSHEVIVSPGASEVNQNNGCTTPNLDSGFHEDSTRSVTTSPQLGHQSAFSTFHRPDVAQTSPDPTTKLQFNSTGQHRSAFSPYVRPRDNAVSDQIAGDSSQCSSSPISQHSNIWRPF